MRRSAFGCEVEKTGIFDTYWTYSDQSEVGYAAVSDYEVSMIEFFVRSFS